MPGTSRPPAPWLSVVSCLLVAAAAGALLSVSGRTVPCRGARMCLTGVVFDAPLRQILLLTVIGSLTMAVGPLAGSRLRGPRWRRVVVGWTTGCSLVVSTSVLRYRSSPVFDLLLPALALAVAAPVTAVLAARLDGRLTAYDSAEQDGTG